MKSTICLVLFLAGCRVGSGIQGGTPVQIEKHPYQVVIDKDGEMACGGALLSTKTVLTAASCFLEPDYYEVDYSSLTVRVGSHFREAGGASYGVIGYLVHPKYSGYTLADDLLLLYLEEAVTLRAAVQTVGLANPSVTSLRAGQKLILTGFGDLTEGEVLASGQQRQLQAVALPFINQDVCDEFYIGSSDRDKACAGAIGKGPCGKRDDGSPIVNWLGELVGIASRKLKSCAVLGQPAMFTNLVQADLHKWITDNLDRKQSD